MKVLITGANGQLGYALQKTGGEISAEHGLELTPLTREQLNFERPETISGVLNHFSPDIIINAAAYTAVDKAESEPALAQLINADAVKQIALWCQLHKKMLVQVSTDFVFDGKKSSPYVVEDKTSPIGAYGKTKRQGELVALSECESVYVVRTGWVYGEHGANFAKTILRLAKERELLGIVSDQVGTPTYAMHLAQMLWQLVLQKPSQKIWHFSDAGVASWYDFAVAIVEEATVLEMLTQKPIVKPIATVEYPTPAQRPEFSVLNKINTWNELAIAPIHWRAALIKMLIALKQI